jgi:hypothetical protein
MSADIQEIAVSNRPEWTPVPVAPIASAEQYQSVCGYLISVKAFQKRVTDFFKPHKDRALAAHRALCADEQKALEPALADERACKAAIVAFDTEQERIRREEEAKLREQARLEAERVRLEEAAALELQASRENDTALLEEAHALMDEPVQTPAVIVPRTTPKVAGISYREVWKFRITDSSKLPRDYTRPDEIKIGGVVRAMKGVTNIPGVEVYCDRIAQAGSR